MSDHESRLDELFDRALDLPPTERETFIARECSDEEAAALRDLLRNDLVADDDFLERAPSPIYDTARTEPSVPERIGQYSIVRELGRGGMGVVYEAEQETPRRRVALKVVRTAFLSPTLVSRFRREAQALAQLQHRGIAHIYESGSTRIGGDDVPFFAMEYIDGLPLDEHARQKNLSVRQRLELIARVCDAVQHAHQKGIIHRDLKPSNVLIVEESTETTSIDDTSTVVDSVGQPKILDFGVARIIDGETQVTLHTTEGQLVGTLAYMSPEQVGGHVEELDTRCDVYALGVMLYAVLAGRPPHDLGGLPVTEALRAINEDAPASLGAVDASFRGDIATIASKAMDKDRERRYASAGLMADDIRRHLRDEPIAARPASTFYQLRKFTRRNRALVGGVAVSFVLLVLGVVGTSFGLARSLQANAELKQANTELSEANDDIESIVMFQDDLFATLSLLTMGDTIRHSLLKDMPQERRAEFELLFEEADFTNAARNALGETLYWPAIERIDQLPDGQPLVRARLTRLYAERLFGLDFEREAAELMLDALDLYRAELGSAHQETLLCESMAAWFLDSCGDLETAIALATSNLSNARVLDPPDHDRLEAALRTLGGMYIKSGRLQEGRAHHEEALRVWRETGAGGDANAAFNMTQLAEILAADGDFEAAETRYREALSFARDTRGWEDFTTLVTAASFGMFLCHHGQRDEGIELSLSTLESLRRIRGNEDSTTLYLRHALASVLTETKRFAEAEALALEQASILRERHGSGSKELSEIAALLVSLYEAWHEVEPGAGYEAKAARWRAAAVSRATTG